MKRSKQLHNFNFQDGLTWGRTKLLSCMNVNPIRSTPAVDIDQSSDSTEHYHNRSVENHRIEVDKLQTLPVERSSDGSRRKLHLRFRINSKGLNVSSPAAVDGGSGRKAVTGVDDEISTSREKLMMEYQTEIGKMQKSILKNNSSSSKEKISPIRVSPSAKEGEENSPKSKRIRGMINADDDDDDLKYSVKKSKRPRRNLEKKDAKPRFSISLSRKEIEEDIFAMTGRKATRKPNRRPRNIQMKIDNLCPGLWLTEVHPDRYKVDENRKN